MKENEVTGLNHGYFGSHSNNFNVVMEFMWFTCRWPVKGIWVKDNC